MNKTALIITILLLSLTVTAVAQTSEIGNKPDPANKLPDAPSQPPATKLYDESNWLAIVMAAESGGGFTPGGLQPTAYAGVKFGVGSIVLNLGYDRLHAHDGFATQLSGMLPVFRFPGPQKNESKNYLRVYAEPGIGYRAGGGGFGGYLSGGVMVALLSDKRLDLNGVSPYIEYQRRVPFTAPGRGDNRFTFGLMMTLCAHCGFE